MNNKSMKTIDRLRQLIAESCEIEPHGISETARLRGYGIDSVRVMDLMLSVEEEFAIQFRMEELESVLTVGDLATYVDRLRSQRPGGVEGSPCTTLQD